MRNQSRYIRYGKPCMTNLPPKLGRQIISEILAAKPFDNSKLEAENHRVLERLSARIDEMKRNESKLKDSSIN